MDNFTLDSNIKVLCITADSFPEGITEAHEKLHNLLPYSDERRYFGISRPDEKGVIIYKAAAEELHQNEEKTYACETFVIQSGLYICITVKDYTKDISSIGKAFKVLISQKDIDPMGYCIEWYLNHNDVRCLVKLKT